NGRCCHPACAKYFSCGR
nr:RecName: Full=Alpha-conotoxin-like Mn1.4; Flags: Precursor [Conus monachus]